MSTLEKWLALLTLLGAMATALTTFVTVLKPKPASVVAVHNGECKTVAQVGRWWLMRCPE